MCARGADAGRAQPGAASPTYIMMFPHLIAGPIVRYADIARRIARRRRMTVAKIGLGVQYFIVGPRQKVLIANAVAPLADHAFGLGPGRSTRSRPGSGPGLHPADLFRFLRLFEHGHRAGLPARVPSSPRTSTIPMCRTSITEFWRRWHISLSSWFRDYVYIPLGGNRARQAKTLRNLLIVFFLTGLWHGAAWTLHHLGPLSRRVPGARAVRPGPV